MISTISGAIGLLVAASILMMIRKDRLHVSHGMGWIAVAIGFALLGFAPGIIDLVAGKFGIDYPPILAIVLSIVLMVLKMVYEITQISKHSLPCNPYVMQISWVHLVYQVF